MIRQKDNYNAVNSAWWIFGKFVNEKDPLRKGFLDNFGFLMSLGGIYLSFPGNWIISAIHIGTSYAMVLLFGYTVFISFDDVETLFEALHYIMQLMFASIPAIINGLIQRRKMDAIMRSLGEGVYDYAGTLDKLTAKEIQSLTLFHKERKGFHTKLFIGSFIVIALALTIFRPTILYNLKKPVYDEDFDGINRHVAVHYWFPLDSRVPFYNVLCFVLQYLSFYTVPAAVWGVDCIFLCISEEIIIQLKTVCVTIKNCKRRAIDLMKHSGSNDVNKYLSICLKHSINHHIAITRLFQDFRDYYYYLLLCLMIESTFMVCLQCLIFTIGNVSAINRITSVSILCVLNLHLLIFCWYGEQIKELSCSVGQSMYESDWFEHSTFLKPYLLLVIQRGLKPLKVSAGGFMEMSMDTFASVLQAAYSYFNLLNRVR